MLISGALVEEAAAVVGTEDDSWEALCVYFRRMKRMVRRALRY